MSEGSTSAREAPVSFRPGKMRTPIRQRCVGTITEGAVAKRDLARYYLLLGEALGQIRLTRSEASFLARMQFQYHVEAALAGDPFAPEYPNPSDELVRIVQKQGPKMVDFMTSLSKRPPARPEDAPTIRAMPQRTGKLASRLQAKVQAMTPLQRAALLDALDRLRSESEEDVGNVDNWVLIGVSLEEDDFTMDDLVS